MRKLTLATLAEAQPRLRSPPTVDDAGLDLALNPRDEGTFELPGRPSLDTLLAKLGPVDQEAARLDRLQYLDPEILPARAALFATLPQGLYVTKVRSEAATNAGLREGDLIVRVEGETAAGPQTLLRWLSLRPPATPIALTVLRGAEKLELKLPSPAR